MSALDFIANYKAIRARMYAPRPEIAERKKTVRFRPSCFSYSKPIGPKPERLALAFRVYSMPIGPVMPSNVYISRQMAKAQLHLQTMRIAPIPLSEGIEILRQVCAKYGLTADEIKSPRRNVELILPRQEFCYRMATETEWSNVEIGRFLGGRNHATIIHARREFEAKLARGEVSL